MTSHANPDPQYLLGQSGIVNWQGPWVRCDGLHRVSFNAAWGAAAGVTGTLSVEGTDYPFDLPAYTSAALPASAAFVVTLNVTVSHGTFPAVTAAAGNCEVIVENPPRWVRLVQTGVAGATARTFNVFRGGYSH